MSIKLGKDALMPLIGIGTYKVRGSEIVNPTLEFAIKSGYRSIDTASVYRNELDIGNWLHSNLKSHQLQRSDIFITSKLGPKDQGYESCKASCNKSMQNLQTDYLDLYLIHWPGTQGKKPDDPGNRELRKQSWLAMEEMHSEGVLKAIGVSNYTIEHLQELFSYCTIKPHVLQTEHHPHLQQNTLIDFCQKNGIHFQAYSSLGTSSSENQEQLLQEEVVERLAEKYEKSQAQVLLKWAVQQNIGVIPKSTNGDHIKENIDLFGFELSDDDIIILNNLNKSHHYCWDPAKVV